MPVAFLLTFVTVMTFIPSCSGPDRITHRTSVGGVELLHGQVAHPAQTPPPLIRAVALAQRPAVEMLAIALVALALTLVLRRRAALIGAIAGAALLVEAVRLEAALSAPANVQTHAEAGQTAAITAALLVALAGVCMLCWRDRTVEPHARCAGFWRRLLAWTIDVLLGVMVTAVLDGAWSPASGLWLLGFALAYWPLMQCSRQQATLGKQALGLIVTDERGERLTLARACARHLVWFVSIATLVGAALAGWTDRRQALHDLATGTVVVRALDR